MSLLVGLPESSGGRVRSFPSRHHHNHGSPRSHITRGWTIGPLVAAVLRHKSNPIVIISQSVSMISSFHLCLGPLSGLFPSSLPAKILYAFLISSIHTTCSTHFILLDFIILIIRYLGSSTNYGTPHYAIFSDLPSRHPS